MDKVISDFISPLRLGEVQSFKNMQVISLFSDIKEDLVYLTLKEALEKRQLVVQEVSAGGSVPELKVFNQSDIPVLLLDGEELSGAKQNRVLNTTILVKGNSELIIPVSCTEQGRWSYQTDVFYDSGIISPAFIRAKKASSVSASLKQGRSFESDQQEVWENISLLRDSIKVDSATGAMKDAFKQKEANLVEYLKAFHCLPHQKGIFVFIDGEIAGWDILSRESAFAIIFPKLVKSYAMDALMKERKGMVACQKPEEEANKFLAEIRDCKQDKYPSTGQGFDYRFEGIDKVGSALVVQEEVIHTAFFKVSKEEKAGKMARYKRRRGYRIY